MAGSVLNSCHVIPFVHQIKQIKYKSELKRQVLRYLFGIGNHYYKNNIMDGITHENHNDQLFGDCLQHTIRFTNNVHINGGNCGLKLMKKIVQDNIIIHYSYHVICILNDQQCGDIICFEMSKSRIIINIFFCTNMKTSANYAHWNTLSQLQWNMNIQTGKYI